MAGLMARIRTNPTPLWQAIPAKSKTQHRVDSEQHLKPWKLGPQKHYILHNASIIDPIEGKTLSGRTIRLSGGLISSVSKANDNSHPSFVSEDQHFNDAITIDCSDKFICPGLIDCHVHLSSVPGIGNGDLHSAMPREAAESLLRQPYLCEQALKRGFTTLRDTGGATLSLKEAIADNVFPGPRLFIAGKALSQTGGHGDTRGSHDQSSLCCGGGGHEGLSVVCDGVPDVIRAAREQLRTGADFIKIMASGGVASPTDRLTNTQFTSKEIRAIVEVAESYGTYVTAHAYTDAAIRHAVGNGVRGIEHGNLIDEGTARYLQGQGAWLTPTLVTYEAMADGQKYPGFLPPENAGKNRDVLEAGLESIQLAGDAGVKMCFGSDLLGMLWGEQSREFAIRRRVLSDVDVLRSATVNAAEMLGQKEYLGQVKEGFAADLLVLGKNPLEDVTLLAEPEKHLLAVVKDGRVWDSRWSKLPVDTARERTLIE